MLTIEKVICLKAVPMFPEASEEILADVAGILEDREVKAGEVVFEKGEAGDSLYVIVHGQVRASPARARITHLGEHDIFGELALLDPEPRVASVAAVTDTGLFRLDREGFAVLMAGNIEIVRGVLARVVRVAAPPGVGRALRPGRRARAWTGVTNRCDSGESVMLQRRPVLPRKGGLPLRRT